MRKIAGIGMPFVLPEVRIVTTKLIMHTIQFVCKFNNPHVIPCKQSVTTVLSVRRRLQHLVHVPVPVPAPVHLPHLFVPRRLLVRHHLYRLLLRLRLLHRRRVRLLVRLSSVLILLQLLFRRRLRVPLTVGLGDRRVMIIRRIVMQRLIISINLSAPTFNPIFVPQCKILVIMVHS
jgi:hypothetical protein